jgi:hypothetical protein
MTGSANNVLEIAAALRKPPLPKVSKSRQAQTEADHDLEWHRVATM